MFVLFLQFSCSTIRTPLAQPGEEEADTAVRETEEETGMRTDKASLKFVGRYINEDKKTITTLFVTSLTTSHCCCL
jgi:8-oxo-dGTP pyrophosphatase MutT (NUDIX family)